MSDQAPFNGDIEKNPATLEREINQTRSEMNQTLDALEQRLTPGQLVDECLKFFGKQGSEVLNSLGTCAKENPVPLMLTAIGITWMMLPSQRRTPAMAYRSHYGDEVYGGNPKEYSATEQGTLSNVGDKIKSGAASAREQLVSAKDALRDQAISSKDALADQFAASKETVQGAVNRTTELAQAKVQQAREGFNTLLEEQPLIIGALGIAIGAALGAMLPSSEPEDRLLGEVSDTAMSKVKEQGAQAYERARQTVTKVAEEMKQGDTGDEQTSVKDTRSGDSRSSVKAEGE